MILSFMRVVRRILMVLTGISVVAMMIHVSLDAAIDFFFNRPLTATIEIAAYYYMIAIAFLPLAIVEADHSNIVVDLFTQFLPGRIRNILYQISCLLSAAFVGCLVYRTFLDAVRSTIISETVMANFVFKVWPSRWFLPIGFAALMITFLQHFFIAWKNPLFFESAKDDDEIDINEYQGIE